MKALTAILFLSFAMLAGCGGGGGGGGVVVVPPAAPADRFVLSGNNDGTISVFRSNDVAGYATAVGYFNADNAFAIVDMIYDESNGRVVLITNGGPGFGKIIVLSFDVATGEVVTLSERFTSGFSSHLALNSAGTAAYVASGDALTTEIVDVYAISAAGILSDGTSQLLGVDPDYIKLNPAETHLYVVSRSNARVLVFDVNADTSLAGSPLTVITDTSPTAIGFNLDGTTAYLTRQSASADLVVYSVGANGSLSQTTTLTTSNTPVDMALSDDGQHLYVLDSSNTRVNHYTIDASTGMPTFFANTNVNFVATDLAISLTGAALYVGHSENDVVSSIDIDQNDGSLTFVESVRAFRPVNSVAAIGGLGRLQPTAQFLLAPADTGLSRFAIAADGMLTLAATENSFGALMDGEVAVDYAKGLLLGAGENTAQDDLLASYQFDPVTGSTSAVNAINATVSADSNFQRVELGRSGRFMYVLDEDQLTNTIPKDTGFIRTYAFDANGVILSTAVDIDAVNEAPENLSLHPAGRLIYSINSFDDNITQFRVSRTDGTLTNTGQFTPGLVGNGLGRPIDMRFHPNGRFAYVSLEDDRNIVRYPVGANGLVLNPISFPLPTNGGLLVEPRPLGIHPNGKYVYVGEHDQGMTGVFSVAVLPVNASNYTLSFQSRISVAGNPSWISVDPQGRFLYVRFSGDNKIQVLGIDQTTGDLTDTAQVVSAGSGGGFLPTMTIVAPLQ